MFGNVLFSKELSRKNGTTLVELLVSMALLLSVILPASAFLGYIAHSSQNKDKIIALGEAQSSLELLLSQKKYEEKEVVKKIRSGWTLQEKVAVDSSFVVIKVKVLKGGKKIVSLSTVRFDYEANK